MSHSIGLLLLKLSRLIVLPSKSVNFYLSFAWLFLIKFLFRLFFQKYRVKKSPWYWQQLLPIPGEKASIPTGSVGTD
jgi:hypothetical protein